MRTLIVDQYGRPARRSQEPAWPAAGTGRRVRHWYPGGTGINDLIATGGIGLLRERSHQEARRNPYASRALDIDAAYAVGTGITPKPMVTDDALEAQIKDYWEEFVENSDADGQSDFYGQQALTYRGAREGGDAFIRLRQRRRSDGLTVPLQLQLLEAEFCDESIHRDLGNGHTIRAGIEFDAIGRRTAYWMWPSHPGESLGKSGAPKPVPADQIIHVYRVLRPGQVRGVPNLAVVLGVLKEIEDARDSYVLKKKIANLYVSWETTATDGVSVFDEEGDQALLPEGSALDIEGETYTPIAGDHHVLAPGRTVEFSKPPLDSDDFAAFIKTQLRAVAAGAGCTYEQVSQDLEGTSFSSIRAGLVQFRRLMEQIQLHMLIFQLCRPVWRRFMETLILGSLIKVPAAEARRVMRAKWQPPGWEYVEPEKDIRAAVRRIRAGLSSREREAAKLGIDVEELDREIQRDNQRALDMGLVFDSNPASDKVGSASIADEGEGGDSGDEGDAESGQKAAEFEAAHVAA